MHIESRVEMDIECNVLLGAFGAEVFDSRYHGMATALMGSFLRAEEYEIHTTVSIRRVHSHFTSENIPHARKNPFSGIFLILRLRHKLKYLRFFETNVVSTYTAGNILTRE